MPHSRYRAVMLRKVCRGGRGNYCASDVTELIVGVRMAAKAFVLTGCGNKAELHRRE